MKKKVLVLSSAHPWDDERVFNKITKSLSKRYETVLCAVAENDFQVVDGIKVYGFKKLPRSKRYKNYSKIIKIVKKEMPDLIHFHDPDLLLLALYFKLVLRRKVIYDVHEDYFLAFQDREYLPKFIRNLFSFAFDFFEKGVSKLLDGVVVVTEDIFNKFNCKNKVILKNFPTIDEWQERQEYNLNGTINLVYIGNVSYHRGITNLILAVNHLLDLDIRLDIIGPAESKDYFEEIKKFENEKIKIWGRVPKSCIPEILKNAHIGFVTLLPLKRYLTSLPLKLFEYMAAGMPVIASNFKLWKDIIEGSDCGITVDPADIGQIRDAILYFYNNRQEIVKKGQNSYRAFIEMYNWSKEEEKLFDFYKKIMG
ncbi:glycosyltransferase family 4 protein [Caldicellulosiruptor naganoensis]|uniref:Glycosyltransferase family 4 protein n=1 Tax=Caldicellulosiruptor naganoensis TaxID=29324 RepID=A0ABY7BG60_9FIRM|nr:glycosyltransferase family 4 protein [Caldicellulosiruptor naganoensis]WAM30720.1 glycosyltransferase family 4 protein [Caldicellulosiruptor naganoensis]